MAKGGEKLAKKRRKFGEKIRKSNREKSKCKMKCQMKEKENATKLHILLCVPSADIFSHLFVYLFWGGILKKIIQNGKVTP